MNQTNYQKNNVIKHKLICVYLNGQVKEEFLPINKRLLSRIQSDRITDHYIDTKDCYIFTIKQYEKLINE